MAHFAKIENGFVVSVVMLNNDDIIDPDGAESEQLGVNICVETMGPGLYKQTSFSGSFRSRFAAVGMLYDESRDAFIVPQPFPSWTLDSNNDWMPPVPFPESGDGGPWYWDEDNQLWTEESPY